MSSEHSNRDADLPSGWERVPLREIAEINPGLEIRIEDDEEHVNFVPMRAVEPEGAGLLRPEVRAYGEVKKGYTVFRSGDVIMAKITPCMENGKTTVVPELPDSVCFGSTEFHVIRPETGIDPRWISNFLLQHEIRRLAQRSMAGGVGQMRVPGSFVEGLNIPVPPRDEAQRIFSELDELFPDLDAAVIALQSVQKKLPDYKATVLKAAFEGKVTSKWREQHAGIEPASELLKRILDERRQDWEKEQLRKYKEAGKEPPNHWKTKYREPIPPDTTTMPELPQGWCWATLDQLADVGTGATPNRSNKKYYENGSLPWVTSTCVNHPFVTEPAEYVTALALQECNLTIYAPGTILLAMYGEGKTRGMCTELLIETTTNQALAAIVAHREVKDFLKLFLTKNYHHSRRAASGGVQPNLNLGHVRSIIVPLAPAKEEEVIFESVQEQLSVIQHMESEVQVMLNTANALRQAALRRSFKGELVPQDPNDEPASELLKRIAAEREERTRVAKAAKNAIKNGFRSGHAANFGA